MATTTGERRPAQKAEAPIVRPDVARKGVGLVIGCLVFYALLVTVLLVFFGQGSRIEIPGTGSAPGANLVEENGSVFVVVGDVVKTSPIQQGFLDLHGDIEHRAEITVTFEIRLKPGTQVSDPAEAENVRKALPRLEDQVQLLLLDYDFTDLFKADRLADLKERIKGTANQQLGGVVAAVYIKVVPEW